MSRLENPEGPIYYSYLTLIRYLTNSRSETEAIDDVVFRETLSAIAVKMLDTAKSDVYLADGRAYIVESLSHAFPELDVFQLTASECFIMSKCHPGVWVETQRFSNLHSLSKMRRELRKTNVVDGLKSVDVIRILLGIDTYMPDSP